MVYSEAFTVSTNGYSDVRDVTGEVRSILGRSGAKEGLVGVFVVGSTASVSTIEHESALVEDLKELLEKLIPSKMHTRHSATWGDDNGFSHLRATLMGPGITVPVRGGELVLGTWQQIILIDHDNRERNRTVHVQVVGE